MIRLATITKRATLAAAALAVTAAAAPTGAHAAATPTSAPSPAATPAATTPAPQLDEDVVIVVGPEVPADCETTAPLRKVIQTAAPEVTGGVKTTFTGRFHLVSINPDTGWCRSPDGTEIQADGLDNAALALGRTIAAINRQRGAVDVVTIGSAGPVLRYALTMGARKRAGYKAEDEQIFEGNLDVQDAVAIGGVMDGLAYRPAACRGDGFCDDLIRPAAPDVDRPIQWQLMDDKLGRNPQGIHGTDWTLISLAGDRFAPESTALGMDAAHRTAYDVPTLTLEGALADASDAQDMPAHYVHAPKKQFVTTTKAAHPLTRILQDILYGSAFGDDAKPQEGPAFAPGCTGYIAPSSGSIPPSGDIPPTTGATVSIEPTLANWQGDKRAVRVLKVGMLDALATCFKQDPKDAGRFLAQGPQFVRVNGLEFQLPTAKDFIQIDVRDRVVKRTRGTVEMRLPVFESTTIPLKTFDDASIVDLNLKFPMNAADGAMQSDDGTLFSWTSPSFQLFGLKSTGALTLRVVKGGFQVEGALSLPGVFSTKLGGDATPECSDILDNDKDGKADMADSDCAAGPDTAFEDVSKRSGFGIAFGTSNSGGMSLDKVTGSVGGELRLGPLRTSGSIAVEWLRRDKELKFTVDAALPAVSNIGAKLKIGFKNGQLNSIYGEANGLNVPLWSSGWYFQRLGLGMSGLSDGQQKEILISTSVSFLRKIAGKYLISVDGDLTIGWGAPWKVKLTGAFNFLDDRFGSASMAIDQSFGAKIDVLLGREFGIYKDPATGKPQLTLTPQGKLSGAVNLAGEMDIGASVQACVKGKVFGSEYKEPWCLSKVDIRVNKFNGQPAQMSACFRTNVWVSGAVSVGFVAKLNETPTGYEPSWDWITHSCDVADYGGKLAQATGPQTDGFTVRAGEDKRVVEIRGTDHGDAPRVTLVAPDGTRYATPTDTMGAALGPDAYVVTGLGGKTAFILNKPQLGQWKVETAPGSPAVTGIDVVNVLPEPEVKAHVVRGRAGQFALVSDVKREPGQTVRFVERTDAGLDHQLATSSGGSHRTSFRPAFGPAGKRNLVAVVMQDGNVRREITVGSYVAPAPARPGRVRGIVVRRRGELVSVTWQKAKHAASYEVLVSTPDGRDQAQIVRGARRVTVKDVVVPGRVDVQIRALRGRDEMPGPAAHAHATGLPKARRGGHHHR